MCFIAKAIKIAININPMTYQVIVISVPSEPKLVKLSRGITIGKKQRQTSPYKI